MFNNICHLEHHICKFMIASWMLTRSVKYFLWVLQKLKSSAYLDYFNTCSVVFSSSAVMSPHGNCAYILYTKNCTRCIQLMYTKFIQNVYKMYTIFRQTFVYTFCIQN